MGENAFLVAFTRIEFVLLKANSVTSCHVNSIGFFSTQEIASSREYRRDSLEDKRDDSPGASNRSLGRNDIR